MDYSLYNIESNEFRILERHEDEDCITYDLEPIETPVVCPTCGFDNIKQNGKNTRRARDLSEHAKRVGLIIHSHRYFCLNCHTSWSLSFKSIDDRAKMTRRMHDYICIQALKVPFSHIKDDLDISVPTIKDIFDEHIRLLDSRRKLIAPRVLGLDENYLGNQYRCIYTDIENRLILDITEDRKLRTVQNWLFSLPEKERIECVTMDMWGSYKDAVNAELPDVPIIVDKFHVIKALNDNLDKIRKRIRDSLTSADRRHVKNNRWLLLKNNEELKDIDRVRLEELLRRFPQFKRPYALKEQFRAIYKLSDRYCAEAAYKEWKANAEQMGLYQDFIKTVENWENEIFNYFDYRQTNAITEALNAACKEISAAGRGYSFDVLRAKILYGTAAKKPAKFHYYQRDEYQGKKIIQDTVFRFGYVYKLSDESINRGVAANCDRKCKLDVSEGIDIDELLKVAKTQRFFVGE